MTVLKPPPKMELPRPTSCTIITAHLAARSSRVSTEEGFGIFSDKDAKTSPLVIVFKP